MQISLSFFFLAMINDYIDYWLYIKNERPKLPPGSFPMSPST